MNAPIDTLAFAERFEGAGFGHDQARALAAAFGQAQDSTRADLVTTAYLDVRLSEIEMRLSGELATTRTDLIREMASTKMESSREMATLGSGLNREMGTLGSELSREMVTLRTELNHETATLRTDLNHEMATLRTDLNREMGTLRTDLNHDMVSLKTELIREMVSLRTEMATVGKDVSGRLWSTLAIVAGVSTAVSATIAAGIALVLKMGGL